MTQPAGEMDAAPAAPLTEPDHDVTGHATRRLGLALFLVSAAQLVLQLDFSIVNVAVPTIQREFGVPAVDLQWIVTGYALPFGALLLLGGRIGDMTGHRRLLVTGLVLFGLTSLAAGLAPDAGVLIAARFAQGASAALVAPMTLAAITDLFPDGAARIRAMGIFQGVTAAGAGTGIVLGGILTEYAGWRAIFLVNLPVIAALVIAVLRLLPGGHRAGGHQAGGQQRHRLDTGGALLVTVSVAALIFGLSQGQQRGFGSPLTVGSLVAAVVLGAGFVLLERRLTAPMVPVRMLADPARRVTLAVMLLVACVVAGYVYFITLYMQHVLHFSALRAGLGQLPAPLTSIVASTLLVRRLAARFGLWPVLVAGAVSAGLGQLWLTRLSPSGSYLVSVLPGVLLTAFGLGMLFATLSVLAVGGVAPGDRGLAGGLLAASQQVGMAIGLAVLATAAAARSRTAAGPVTAALASGYRLSYCIGAGIMGAALAAILLLMRPRRTDR